MLDSTSGAKSICVDGNTNVQNTITYSYTVGADQTKTTELAKSLTVSATVGYTPPSETGGANASVTVTGSISKTTGTSETISSSTTTTQTHQVTYSGAPGGAVLYSAWSSVERYSIVDSLGNPWSDPNYTYTNPVLDVRGLRVSWLSPQYSTDCAGRSP